MSRTFFIIAFSLFTLIPATINAQRNKTGGSCSYHYEHSPAVVLFTYPSGNTNTYTEIVFSVNTGNGTDTVSYSSINHMPVKNDTVTKYNIRRGDVFTLETGHMYSGSCNPLVRRFILEKYKPDPVPPGEKVDDTPCTYTQGLDEAYVISVVPAASDSALYDVFFIVTNTRIDTVSFSQVNKRSLSAEEVKKYNLEQGISLTYVENFIDTGVCEPYTREITFEPYDRKKKH